MDINFRMFVVDCNTFRRPLLSEMGLSGYWRYTEAAQSLVSQ